MSEFEVAYHKRWLGMLEPIEGLVVSVPVLVEAECMEKRDPELSRQLAQEAKRADESQRLGDEATALTRMLGKTSAGHVRSEIVSLDDFLSRVLGLTPELFARGAEPRRSAAARVRSTGCAAPECRSSVWEMSRASSSVGAWSGYASGPRLNRRISKPLVTVPRSWEMGCRALRREHFGHRN